LAETLGINEFLGTVLELKHGRFTGRITGTYGVGSGKVEIAAKWATRHGAKLSEFAYYGDSVNDVPMLEAVGFPHAVNPSEELRKIAETRHWPIKEWNKPQKA
jgi:phosphoserine phosphatase